MFDLRSIIPKTDRAFLADSLRIAPEDPKQRKLMLASLCLLLVALGIVLWRNRDFWFPDEQEAEFDEPVESSPVAKAVPVHPPASVAKSPLAATPQPGRKHRVMVEANAIAPSAQDVPDPPPVTISARTVLPPLDVEVVAGDTHRTIRPGSSSVRVDLQPGTPAESIPVQPLDVQPIDDSGSTEPKETAATLTSDAAERVQISAVAAEIVARPVKPDYPLLARQMKVQGSVILKALIGRDGIIQNLRVVSGPRILASAAEDAVRQWHFKPHLEGSEAVETEAKITVNFTISTN
jgi:TonB family protein